VRLQIREELDYLMFALSKGEFTINIPNKNDVCSQVMKFVLLERRVWVKNLTHIKQRFKI
jgi:hypothetical protein